MNRERTARAAAFESAGSGSCMAIELAAELDQEVVHRYAGPVRDCALLEHGADHRPEDPDVATVKKDEANGGPATSTTSPVAAVELTLKTPSRASTSGKFRVHVLPFAAGPPEGGKPKVHVRPARVRSEAVKDRDRADHAEPRDVVRELVELALNLLQHPRRRREAASFFFSSQAWLPPRRVNVRGRGRVARPFFLLTTFPGATGGARRRESAKTSIT